MMRMNEGRWLWLVLYCHSQDVEFILWHPSLPVFLLTSYNDTIKIWAEDSGDLPLIGHNSTVWGVAWDLATMDI